MQIDAAVFWRIEYSLWYDLTIGTSDDQISIGIDDRLIVVTDFFRLEYRNVVFLRKLFRGACLQCPLRPTLRSGWVMTKVTLALASINACRTSAAIWGVPIKMILEFKRNNPLSALYYN